MSKQKQVKNALKTHKRPFEFKTKPTVLAVMMHEARQNWEELCAKDFSQYDCPEDNQ